MGIHHRRQPNITRVVRQIFFEDGAAILANREGTLNLTAFARKISSRVNKTTGREINVKTIAALLSRHSRDISRKIDDQFFTEIKIREITESKLSPSLITVKVYFHSSCKNNPHRFYLVLTRIEAFNIPLLKLTVSNGNLELVIDQQYSGLVGIALRIFFVKFGRKIIKNKPHSNRLYSNKL